MIASFLGFKVENVSGNSILFTAVEADLELPAGSTSPPYTTPPQGFKLGSSQGRGETMSMISPVSNESPKTLSSFSELESSLAPFYLTPA